MMDGVQKVSNPESFKLKEIIYLIYFRVCVVKQCSVVKFVPTPELIDFVLYRNLTCSDF
jgi:hypothetical protein